MHLFELFNQGKKSTTKSYAYTKVYSEVMKKPMNSPDLPFHVKIKNHLKSRWNFVWNSSWKIMRKENYRIECEKAITSSMKHRTYTKMRTSKVINHGTIQSTFIIYYHVIFNLGDRYTSSGRNKRNSIDLVTIMIPNYPTNI